MITNLIVCICVLVIVAFVGGARIGYTFARRTEGCDAARYRHLRYSWVYMRERHKLEWPKVDWYLPRHYELLWLEDQLDASIDDAMARR